MDIEAAYQLVQNDDADVIAKESRYWKKMASALREQADRLRSNLDKVDAGVESDSGRAYVEELRLRFARIEEAAGVADTNSSAWTDIAEQVRANRLSIEGVHSEWKKAEKRLKESGGDVESARQAFSESARAQINVSATNISQYSSTMKPPAEYQPMPDLGGEDSTIDSPGGGPDTTGPGGSSPDGSPPAGSSPGGSVPGGSSPRPGSGGAPAPELQTPPPSPNPAPSMPAPSPAPTPPPSGGLPPALPPGALPPPGTKPPLPPGGTKPPVPPGGTKPALPPNAKPTIPPGGKSPSTMPPGGKPPGTMPPGTKPPANGPRPPQATVKPVIGSRPGTTGMAPTGTGPRPGTTGVSRPVIGARPGPTGMPGAANAGTAPGSRPAPVKALIGNNGVVSNAQRTPRAVRAPKAQFGDGRLNRSVVSGGGAKRAKWAGTDSVRSREQAERSEAEAVPTGGDFVWRINQPTVPAVITGGSWKGVEHDPGFLAELESRPLSDTDEHETVKRLSAWPNASRDDETASGVWAPRNPAGRGVISSAADGNPR